MTERRAAAGTGIDLLVEEGEALHRLQATAARGPGEATPRAKPARRGMTPLIRARSDRRFHVGMSLAFLATAFAGFAPSYYLRGATPAAPLSPLLHAHGLVFTGWLLLLLTQSSLVAARRVDLHRRLGILGALLSVSMIPLGFLTAIGAVRRGFAPPGLDPLVFLIFPMGSIVLFACFVGAALWKRRSRELHRRLILLGTVSIMAPAIARLPFLGLRPVLGLLLSTLFVVAGMIHDRRTRGRVHHAYLWGGLVILLSGPVRFGLGQTEAWHALARWLVG